jgi:hypothetical protein
MIIKRIGFKENKKCRICENLAMIEIGSFHLCPRHLEGLVSFMDIGSK